MEGMDEVIPTAEFVELAFAKYSKDEIVQYCVKISPTHSCRKFLRMSRPQLLRHISDYYSIDHENYNFEPNKLATHKLETLLKGKHIIPTPEKLMNANDAKKIFDIPYCQINLEIIGIKINGKLYTFDNINEYPDNFMCITTLIKNAIFEIPNNDLKSIFNYNKIQSYEVNIFQNGINKIIETEISDGTINRYIIIDGKKYPCDGPVIVSKHYSAIFNNKISFRYKAEKHRYLVAKDILMGGYFEHIKSHINNENINIYIKNFTECKFKIIEENINNYDESLPGCGIFIDIDNGKISHIDMEDDEVLLSYMILASIIAQHNYEFKSDTIFINFVPIKYIDDSMYEEALEKLSASIPKTIIYRNKKYLGEVEM